MNKRLLSVACLVWVIMFASACKMNVLKGSGEKTTTAPAVASFAAVEVDLPLKISVNVVPGSQPGIQLSGFKNVIQHIKTRVENNTLVITTDLDDTWTIDGAGVDVQVTVPSLTGLSLDGSPDADVHGSITGRTFDIDVSGASTIKLDNVNVDSFSIQVSGAGDLIVTAGAVKYAEYEIDGAGKVQAYPLQAAITSASINGAGTLQVTASEKLEAEISGAGTVKYKGHPTVSQEVSGAGTIKDAN
jgi:hypothetical protein